MLEVMKVAILLAAEMISSKSSGIHLHEPLSTSNSSHNLFSFARIDPAQEIARLRHSISLLEAYVFPNQRNNVPLRRSSDATAFLVPKQEAVDHDINDKGSAAPGMLGSQVQGGLYAGPTSAATHLLMVSNLTKSFRISNLHLF
jgi:hypothetical protein